MEEILTKNESCSYIFMCSSCKEEHPVLLTLHNNTNKADSVQWAEDRQKNVLRAGMNRRCRPRAETWLPCDKCNKLL
eukprot:9802691-Karenia_brevis.AAC.1